MNFLSLFFIGALPLIFVLYNFIPQKLRPLLLLIGSWLFYLYGSPDSFWILLIVTLISYAFGLFLDKKKSLPALILGVMLVLSFLLIFKYSGLKTTLPVGISFYTFQTISYMIDVYKKSCKAEANLFHYSLFVSFFPQLVAGPIERSKILLPQLKLSKNASSSQLKESAILMLTGYYKKIVVADFFAPLVDIVYSQKALRTGPVVLLASVLFSLQIYADFSGYSDIARGCAKLFGIELTANFDHPYLTRTLREFWKKWHITLTRWLTDYVYIPLGGSRKGKPLLIINTLIVFLISGIWHGAGIKFIIWGLGHGIIVLIEDISPVKRAIEKLPGFLAVPVNFLIVDLLWIFFRAPNIKDALSMIALIPTGWQSALSQILNVFSLAGIPQDIGFPFMMLAASSLYLLPKALKKESEGKNYALLFIMALITVFVRMYHIESGIDNAFIYFRF